MANPNIVNVTSIYGNTAYVTPGATTVSTAWTYNGTTSLTGLTPAANTVNRVTQILVSNNTAGAVNATVNISNNATYASGTAYPIAYQIAVPANATLQIVDKTLNLYVTENQSIGVISATSNALTFIATFEAIT